MNNLYYNKTETLSYHAFLNLLYGTRGVGKTYSFKTWSLDDFLKNGKQFVWVRRYASEIKIMRKKFFEDIAQNYPAHKFSITGNDKMGEFKVDGKTCGYYIALNTSALAKSTPFPLVDKIIFDEFLIIGNTHHYIKDEVVIFLELIETIFRDRETNPNAVQPRGVYLLANNVTIANPYNLYFNVPQFKGRFWRDKQRDILVEYNRNEAFIEKKKTSHMGRLTKGTQYYDYAIENESYLDNDRFIRKRPKTTSFYCAIDYNNRTYGFWIDYKNGEIYCNYQYDPNSYNHYSLTKDDHSINTFLIKNMNNTYIKNLVWLYRAGCMYFDDNQIKAQAYEMLSYFVR